MSYYSILQHIQQGLLGKTAAEDRVYIAPPEIYDWDAYSSFVQLRVNRSDVEHLDVTAMTYRERLSIEIDLMRTDLQGMEALFDQVMSCMAQMYHLEGLLERLTWVEAEHSVSDEGRFMTVLRFSASLIHEFDSEDEAVIPDPIAIDVEPVDGEDGFSDPLAGGIEAFSPTDLPGVLLWLDASDPSTLTLSGGRVLAWDDKSGQGNHATQEAETLRPFYQDKDPRAHDLPSISDGGLVLPYMTYKTLYFVAAYRDGEDEGFATFATLLSGPGAYGSARIMGYQGKNAWIDTSSIDTTSEHNGRPATNTPFPFPLAVVVFRGEISQVNFLGYNPEFLERQWDGPICEVIFTDGTETREQESALLAYFQAKWSIEI